MVNIMKHFLHLLTAISVQPSTVGWLQLVTTLFSVENLLECSSPSLSGACELREHSYHNATEHQQNAPLKRNFTEEARRIGVPPSSRIKRIPRKILPGSATIKMYNKYMITLDEHLQPTGLCHFGYTLLDNYSAKGHFMIFVNTFTAIVDFSRFNNSCLKSPASTLVDLTFQSRALRSFNVTCHYRRETYTAASVYLTDIIFVPFIVQYAYIAIK